MTRPWVVLAQHETDEDVVELRQRGDDFLITIGGRVLMNSFSRRSEEQLATLGLAPIANRQRPTVLVSGLGMGFTLRAALDALPADARVVVVEIDPVIVEWCKGPLGPATGHAIADPRVELVTDDVARVIRESPPGRFDAILLDLYEGPNDARQGRTDPFYSARALEEQRRAIAPGGVLGVWGEDTEPAFTKRMTGAGFATTTHAIGQGGRKHAVWIGLAPAGRRATSG